MTCPACGEESPDRFRFCGACGAALERPEAPREERKVVSVLFCDLVGFTGRSEQMDVEDVRGTLAPYHALLRRELERFGGTVEKFIGDAVMALFGAPSAHEDDAERAVRAALAIREAIAARNEQDGGLDLHVRIGVNTGEALVVVDADPARGEGMASGDVVNTAARLQAAAPVDGILVGEGTYRSTDRVISYQRTGDISAKGKIEPVPAWEAIEARARVGGDPLEGHTPLIGRTHELGLLADALRRARAERRPQLVTLVGVPGIGKSRLIWELLRQVEEEPDFTYWRQGRSLPYGDGVTFWALGEMVKAQAGILDTDSGEDAAEKLHETVADHITDPAEASWVEGHLLPLVGSVGEHAHACDRGREAASAWRRFLEALAERHPLVLVFEDLHWADPQLLDFIDYLVDWAAEVPMLVLCTARPELLDRRAGWGGGKRNALTIALSSLADDDIARLISVLLDQAALPADTQGMLLAAAEGTPLYAEEYVRMLIDRGHLERDGVRWRLARGELPVPESVQALIAARLDALPAADKRVLQDAATVGKVFWLGAVAAVSGDDRPSLEDTMHRLERRDFVRRERRATVAGESEYAFRHVLTRDVAYGQIPRTQRAAKHRLVAEWVESLSAGREDTAEMRAYHYRQALTYSRDAGEPAAELVERTRRALTEAGDRALALNALNRAQEFYSAALELWPADDIGHARLVVRAARMWKVSHDDVQGLERAADQLVEAGELQLAGLAELSMTGPLWNAGRKEEVNRHQQRARQLFEKTPASSEKAYALNWMAMNAMLQDRHEESLALSREAYTIAEDLGLDAIRAHALNTMGAVTCRSGEPEKGRGMLEESLAIAQRLNDAEALLRSQKNLASVLYELGELEPAQAIFGDAANAARRFGDDFNVMWFEAENAMLDERTGEWERALQRADAFLAGGEPRGRHYMDGPVRESRARIRIALGDLEGAWEDASEAVEFGRASGDGQVYLPAVAVAARVAAAMGRAGETRELAVEVIEAGAAELSPAFWPVDLAIALIEVGDPSLFPRAARRHDTPWMKGARALTAGEHEEAAGIFAAIGARPLEAYARLLAAEQLLGTARHADGEEQLARSLVFWREVGARPMLARGEALLVRSA